MAELFSEEWMAKFAEEWNREAELTEPLGKIGFRSVIGYGFPGDPAPRGVLAVENGKVTAGGPYTGQALNWDIRAEPAQWQKWMDNPPRMAKLGMAFATGRMKFKSGDYASMIKDPRMAGPFIKSFEVMSRVPH